MKIQNLKNFCYAMNQSKIIITWRDPIGAKLINESIPMILDPVGDSKWIHPNDPGSCGRL